MPWILKHTRSDRPMIAEYLCPVHGRFELEVARDANGDPPGEAHCPRLEQLEVGEWLEVQDMWTGRVLEPVPHATQSRRFVNAPCNKSSPFAISAPGYCKVKNVEAVRGGYEKPARETYTNTENLGEGQDLDDWWDDRAKVWDRHRESEIKELANG